MTALGPVSSQINCLSEEDEVETPKFKNKRKSFSTIEKTEKSAAGTTSKKDKAAIGIEERGGQIKISTINLNVNFTDKSINNNTPLRLASTTKTSMKTLQPQL